MRHQKSGYMLVFTFVIIALAMTIVTVAITRGLMFTSFTQTMVNRMKARQLALSGIALAMSELQKVEGKKEKNAPSPQQKEGQPEEEEGAEDAKGLLQKLFPMMGRWQSVKLNEKQDGVTGTIQFCLVNENGKVNLNLLYDFEKKKFIDDADKAENKEQSKEDAAQSSKTPSATNASQIRAFLDALCTEIQAKMGGELSVQTIEQWLQKRSYPINDVTELMEIPGFKIFKHAVFYEPPADDKKEWPIFLTDIFTVATTEKNVDPWLLSDSLCAMWGLNRITAVGKQLSDDTLKQWKATMSWATDWDKFLKPLYGRDYASLPKPITPFLKAKFEPTAFSVLSYGTVGRVTVRLVALLERNLVADKKASRVRITIKELYSI